MVTSFRDRLADDPETASLLAQFRNRGIDPGPAITLSHSPQELKDNLKLRLSLPDPKDAYDEPRSQLYDERGFPRRDLTRGQAADIAVAEQEDRLRRNAPVMPAPGLGRLLQTLPVAAFPEATVLGGLGRQAGGPGPLGTALEYAGYTAGPGAAVGGVKGALRTAALSGAGAAAGEKAFGPTGALIGGVAAPIAGPAAFRRATRGAELAKAGTRRAGLPSSVSEARAAGVETPPPGAQPDISLPYWAQNARASVAAANLPVVPKGYVRLYRGAAKPFDAPVVPLPNAPLSVIHGPGRFFSHDIDVAGFFGKHIWYLDVPEDVVREHRHSLSEGLGTLEVELPLEWASKARRLPLPKMLLHAPVSEQLRPPITPEGPLALKGIEYPSGESVPGGPLTRTERGLPAERVIAASGGIPPDRPPPGAQQKFVDFLNSQEPRALERQTNLARRAELSEKARGVSAALGGGLPTDAAFRAARAAQRGALTQAVFEPVAAASEKEFIPQTVRPELFSQNDLDSLYDTVRASPLKPFDKQNAADALTRALLGELPSPHEVRYLRNVFGDPFGDALMRHRGFGPKAWDTVVDAANLPRTLFQTVLDFSGLLRQGAVLAAARPVRTLQNAPEFMRPLFSEKYFNRIQDSIKTDPLFPRADEAELFFAQTSSDITQREEAFMSRLAQKIPLWGRVVRGSERSYVGGLNKLRFDSFKDSIHGWEKQGITVTPEMEHDLATVLNYATGRGSLGPANAAAPVLSAVFYSPRFLASRIELPFEDLRNLQRAGQAAIKGDPKLAAAYAGLARNTVAFTGAGMAILTLLKLREDGKELNVESDARSPDFGRVRYRHTRFDFWAGYQPIARYTWQVIVQKTKSIPEAQTPDRLNAAQGSDIIARFLRSKLAPGPGLAVDVTNRRTISGQELSLSAQAAGQLAYREFVPFFVQSLNDAAQQYGAEYAPIGIPSAAGVGADTYNPRTPVPASAAPPPPRPPPATPKLRLGAGR